MSRQDTGWVMRTRKYRQRITKSAAGFATGEDETEVATGCGQNLWNRVPTQFYVRSRIFSCNPSLYAR